MFGIGGFELFLILIFGFLIFGPDKLPAIAKTIGRAIAKFRDAQEEMSGQLKKESFLDKDSDEPFKNPLDVLEGAAKDVKKGVKDAQTKVDSATDAVVDAASKVGTSSAGSTIEEDATEHVASFAERKAKYDRERKARKEAEAKAAEQAEREKAEKEEAAARANENPKNDVSVKKVAEASDDVDTAKEEG